MNVVVQGGVALIAGMRVRMQVQGSIGVVMAMEMYSVTQQASQHIDAQAQ